MATKSKTVKVKANYRSKSAIKGDKTILWGNEFTHDGKAYCATVDEECFASLIEAEKVIKA